MIAALSGLFDENFNRGAGWVFYVMGRCVERGANTCRLLAPVRRKRCDGAHARRHARPDRFADHLQLPLSGRRRAGAGARHGASRPVQSAIGRLPGQSDRRGHCDAAGAAARRHPGGASQADDVALRRTDDGAGGDLGRLAEFWRSNSACWRWGTRSRPDISCKAPATAGRKRSRVSRELQRHPRHALHLRRHRRTDDRRSAPQTRLARRSAPRTLQRSDRSPLPAAD